MLSPIVLPIDVVGLASSTPRASSRSSRPSVSTAAALASALGAVADACGNALDDLWARCKHALLRLLGLAPPTAHAVHSTAKPTDATDDAETASDSDADVDADSLAPIDSSDPNDVAPAAATASTNDASDVHVAAPVATATTTTDTTTGTTTTAVAAATAAAPLPRELAELPALGDMITAKYHSAIIARHEAWGPVPFDTVVRLVNLLHQRNARQRFDLDYDVAVVDVVLRTLKVFNYDVEKALMDLTTRWLPFYLTTAGAVADGLYCDRVVANFRTIYTNIYLE